jgi:hypothetical protein
VKLLISGRDWGLEQAVQIDEASHQVSGINQADRLLADEMARQGFDVHCCPLRDH